MPATQTARTLADITGRRAALVAAENARQAFRKLSDRVDDAYQSYAHDNGGDGEGPDWHNAYEYREEGYALGEEAFALPDDESAREDRIEAALKDFPESARYLIAVAADYRLAELVARDDCYPFVAPAMERAA